MKHTHFLYLLLLALSLATGCRKESIEIEEHTVVQPPDEVTTTALSGVIRNEFGPLPNTAVDVYQGETLAGTVYTDAQGAFSTAGIALPIGATITLYAQKETYISAAKRVVASQPTIEGLKMRMSKATNTQFPVTLLANPGDTDLVMVSGYVTDATGMPVSDISVALLWNIRSDGVSTFEADGGAMETDENGYYETLVPKDSVLYFNALQSNFTQFTSNCEGGFLNAADIWYFNFYPFDIVGPFTTDTQLPALTNAYRPQNVAVVSGKVLDCNGNPVSNGFVRLIFPTSGPVFISTNIELHPDGTFSHALDLCSGSIPELRVQGTDRNTNKSTDLQIFTNVVAGNYPVGDLTACN